LGSPFGRYPKPREFTGRLAEREGFEPSMGF